MKKNLVVPSIVTVVGLYAILTTVLILIALMTRMPISFALILSVVFTIIHFLIAPALNDFIFKVFYKCRFDAQIPDYVREFIEQSCMNHDMKYPKIGVIDDGSPNAFTYGRTKNDARVVFTRGLLEILTPEEVKAVIAHELGHANHYDMLFMTVAQIVPLLLYAIAQIFLDVGRSGRSRSRSSSSNNSGNYGALIGLIAYFLYFISEYIILWLSRAREYYADSFAIEETKDPQSLAKALVKIGFGLAVGEKNENSKSKGRANTRNALGINDAKISKGMAISSFNNGTVSKEGIVNAMRWEKWSPWAKLYELNSTHPLISKRILAISDRCEEFGQERYIEFNEVKKESYVDDFLREILVCVLPFIIAIAYVVAFLFSFPTVNGVTATQPFFITTGIFGIAFVFSLFLKLRKTHRNKGYKETTVRDLVGQVKVSNVTSIPCILKGKIIGRGNPGCVFNEDFVLQDETGIMFLDYNQPLYIMNKLSAFLNSNNIIDNEVTVKGWYRRNTAPYVEIYSMECNGKTKKCHTYNTAKVFYYLLLAASVFLLLKGIIGF